MPTRYVGCLAAFLCLTSGISFAVGGEENGLLPDLGVDITVSDSPPKEVLITPTAVESGYIDADRFETLYLPPIRWQVEKQGIYQNLIEKEISRIDAELRTLESQREQLTDELASMGIAAPEQLDENALSFQKAKLELAVLEAEAAALREAAEKRKAALVDAGTRGGDEALKFHKEQIKNLETRLERFKRSQESGPPKNPEVFEQAVADAQSELLMVRRHVALLEGDAARQADAILNAMLTRLAQVEPQRSAMAARVERLLDLAEDTTRARRAVRERQEIDRKLGLLEQRKDELAARLGELQLRAGFFAGVLQRYESALNKAKAATRNSSQE